MKSSIAVIISGVWLTSLFLSVSGNAYRDATVPKFQLWRRAPDPETYQKLLLDRMLTSMDMQADPCDDFYSFACGNYHLVAPKTDGSKQISPIDETVYPIAPIMEQYIRAESDANTSPDVRKMREFYLSCMNGHNAIGTEKDIMQGFQSWPMYDPDWSESEFDWMKAAVSAESFEVPVLFSASIDFANDDQNEAEVLALNLNFTEFIVELSKQPKELRFEMIRGVLVNSSLTEDEVDDMIRRIEAVNDRLVEITLSALETVKTENIGYPIRELQKRMPSCDLPRLVSTYIGREVDVNTQLIVPSEEYVENVCKFFAEADKRAAAYFLWFYVAVGVFEVTETYGGKSAEDLDTYCASHTQRNFKPVVMKLFRKEYLPEAEREEFLQFATNLKHVAYDLIASSTKWLDDTTRQRALKKMDAVKILVDHPDSLGEPWKPYADIEIHPTDYIGNLRRAKLQGFYDTFGVHGQSRINYPLDPYSVSPSFVAKGKGILYFPAISLQPPIYHKFTPSFQKYGALGSTVGHEIMHNFDVNQIEYDEHGQKAKWMPSLLDPVFANRSQCFESQFNAYTLNGTDIHVQGNLTLAENVADADGLKISFKAFKEWMAENPEQVQKEHVAFASLQMNHEQAFFVSFGHMWCDYRSFELLKDQVATDVHTPAMFRIPGALTNIPDFAKTFNCPASSKLSPTKRCSYIID